MRKIPHLKKVLVGSAFAGAFFLGNPAADAQELPTIPEIDSAGFVDQVREDLQSVGIETMPVDKGLTDSVDSTVNGAAAAVSNDASQAVAGAVNSPAAQRLAGQANLDTQLPVPAAPQDYAGVDAKTGEPLTNPAPIGLLEEATQPEFVPQGTDPNYAWKNDLFSKIAAGKPQADYVLHRVPGSYYDAPQIPEESNVAMTEG